MAARTPRVRQIRLYRARLPGHDLGRNPNIYNVENARYTLATGEVPIVGFYRAPPGVAFWLPVCLLLIYIGWIWGGWASAAGQALYSMYLGSAVDLKAPGNLQTMRIVAIALLCLSFVLYLFGKKIVRTLEAIDTFLVVFILTTLITLTIIYARSTTIATTATRWGTAWATVRAGS